MVSACGVEFAEVGQRPRDQKGLEVLGHSSISVTGDTYGQTTDTAARGAVDGWSGALGL
jgi:hypothetical protein